MTPTLLDLQGYAFKDTFFVPTAKISEVELTVMMCQEKHVAL